MTPQELGIEKAFPLISPDGTGVNQGMTIREYFAAKAMQGLISTINVYDYNDLATYSVRAADALLAELAKPQS